MKTALLISTYNWPEALRLVLESAFSQTVLPDEIIIADDGSGSETRALIEEMTAKSPVPIKHVWHEDYGFRKTIIMNKAVAKAKGDYILQIDGDCIIPKHYIEDHLNVARNGYYVGGKRIKLTEEWTKKTFKDGKLYVPYFGTLLQPKGIKRFARLHRLPLLMKPYSYIRSKGKRPWGGIIGASFSFWKEDFIAVNGYNEEYIGWGHEDEELVWRLHFYGIKKLSLHFGGFVYHLYHRERSSESPNFDFYEKKMREGIAQKKTWAENGIDKYL